MLVCLQCIAENIYSSSSSTSSSDESTSSSSDFLSSEDESDRIEHQKIENFVNTINNYSNADFKRHFRLSRTTANIIIGNFTYYFICLIK